MALPRIDAPTYEITLPVSKQNLKFRPFLVKEQKILLMAMESGEKEVIENNVYQILNNCTLSKEIELDDLPVVDIEYYFINLRARSISEVVESKYKCENTVNDTVCGNTMDSEFNLLDITTTKTPENFSDIIALSPTVGLKLKYPTFAITKELQQTDSVTDSAFKLLVSCIDYIYDEDNIYHAHETPPDEIMAFLESLTKQQFGKIEEFVNTMPKINKVVEMKCKKCGFEHKIAIEGLEDFFG